MSNLAGVSGIFVSGLICCALSFGMTVSFHLLRALLTINCGHCFVTFSTIHIISLNSLPAMDAHERPLFNKLLRGLVTLLIFVHC